MLRELDNAALQFLLDATVQLIHHELPADIPFGDAIALDTKHIIAWVKENNPKAYVDQRYDKTRQPKGDPDCKLGCMRRQNKSEGIGAGGATSQSAPPTPAGTPTHQPGHCRRVLLGLCLGRGCH